MAAGPEEYASLKKIHNAGQANSYAIESGLENKEFQIAWISQKNLDFKCEPMPADADSFNEVLVKLVDIVKAVIRYREGEEGARPKPAGVMQCSVCSHYKIHCLGKEAVLGGQTVIENFK